MTEQGRVVAVERDSLWIETLSTSSCSGCRLRQGCGQGLLNRYGAERRNHLRVLPGDYSVADFAVNDQVEIGLPDGTLLSTAAIVYMVPLLALLAGVILGSRGGDGPAVLGAALGLGLGFGLVRWYSHHRRNDPDLQARVIHRVATTIAGSASVTVTGSSLNRQDPA